MELQIVKKIPEGISLKEIVRAITEFYQDCGMYIDFNGFLAHTLERFSWATFLNYGNWDLWMTTDSGSIKGFILASIDKAADNNPCYYLHQAWVSKDIRESNISKTWFPKMKERAKEVFCKQIMIFSIRDFDAYNKFLGGGLKVYAQMLHLALEV